MTPTARTALSRPVALMLAAALPALLTGCGDAGTNVTGTGTSTDAATTAGPGPTTGNRPSLA